MESRLSEEVYKKIEKEQIRIKPRRYFIFCSFFWLFVGGVVFFISAIALSIYLYFFNALKPWAVFMNNPVTLAPVLLFLAFFLVLIFATIVALLYRKGRICCRHENWMLLGALVTGILGLSFLAYGMGIFKNNGLVVKGEELINTKKYWSNPSRGTLSGRIEIFYPEEEALVLYTWTNGKWQVGTEKVHSGRSHLSAGNLIKMVGEEVGDHQFIARQFWAWEN